MKLYAIRDRLINYFMAPFAAPEDHLALASLANLINNQEDKSAISQAPHHFEIWRLASIDEQTGRISGDPEFLADCSGLVRPDGGTPESGPTRPTRFTLGRGDPTGNAPGHARADIGPLQDQTPATDQPGQKAAPGPH